MSKRPAWLNWTTASEILKHLGDIGETENTIVIFTTDNGAEVYTWPDGGMTPFKAAKGTSYEGGFRVPAIIRWPGHVKPGSVENGIFSASTGFPPWWQRQAILTSPISSLKA